MSLVGYASSPSHPFAHQDPLPLHRKPLPNAQNQIRQEHQRDYNQPQSQPQYQERHAQHRHTRTASSSLMSDNPSPPQQSSAHSTPPQTMTNVPPQNRGVSSANYPSPASVPVRQNSGASLTRTASTISGSSPTSYVALMRKQKATVWSDRAQHEDPRMVAQQRAARMRAAAEVQNAALHARNAPSAAQSSSITGGVRSKILHHGAARARDYVQTGLPQSGVPVRLSQNEIDENDEDGDASLNGPPPAHRRTGSGRSSLGSAGRVASTYGNPMYGGVNSSNNPNTTPPSGLSAASPIADSRSISRRTSEETPIAADFRKQDYFSAPSAARRSSKSSKGSKSSPDESQFGDIGSLPVRVKPAENPNEKLSEADLKRRGSVDERTMTMSGYGRLFIANPDA